MLSSGTSRFTYCKWISQYMVNELSSSMSSASQTYVYNGILSYVFLSLVNSLPSIYLVTRANTLWRLFYSALAWLGYSRASDLAGSESFLSTITRMDGMDYLPSDSLSFHPCMLWSPPPRMAPLLQSSLTLSMFFAPSFRLSFLDALASERVPPSLSSLQRHLELHTSCPL